MKKASLHRYHGYVASPGELLVMFFGCLLFLGLGFMMWNALVEVPPVPKKLVLRGAYATQSLSVSKAKASLYFNVLQDQGYYKYEIDFYHGDVGELNVYKFKKLWVAVDLEGVSQFFWAVYDDEFRLIMSRQQIENWARVGNVLHYSMISFACLAVGYLLFAMFRYGVWNRYYFEGGS